MVNSMHKLLPSISVALSLWFPLVPAHAAIDGHWANKCPLPKPEDKSRYQFIDPQVVQKLTVTRLELCSSFKNTDKELLNTEQQKAKAQWGAIMLRNSLCRGPEPNMQFLKLFINSPEYDANKLAFEKYCSDTSENTYRTYWVDRGSWINVELFCNNIQYAVDPVGWRGLLKPTVPSWKRLEDLSRSICIDLRAKKINLSDAKYAWQQEVIRTKSHINSELLAKSSSEFINLLNKTIDKTNALAPKK